MPIIQKISKLITRRTTSYAILLFAAVAGLYLRWDAEIIAVFVLFLAIILFNIEAKYFLYLILLFLILSPFSSLIHRGEYSEDLASLAFYGFFLLIAAVISNQKR